MFKSPFKSPFRKSNQAFDSKRALFINGQLVKGNLKIKRTRRRTEIFQRLLSRVEVNRLISDEANENENRILTKVENL